MKKFLRVMLIVLGVCALIVLVGVIVWNAADRTNGRLVSSGEQRKYLLYVPQSLDPSKAVPLVITLHGFSQQPANLAEVSRWNQLADEEGFIVVYPSGLGFPKRWRVTPTTEDPQAVVKEVQFFKDLIDKLSGEYSIDPTRIYVNGLSNGGGMSLRLACNMPEQVAAIGGVAGAYLVDLNDCTGGVPGIFFHGKADKIVPFEGGPSEAFSLPFPNITKFVNDYAQLNSCSVEEKVILETGNVVGVRYEGCNPGADVEFYTIADGGHTWPGGNPIQESITGKTTQEIDATRLMWEFFNKSGS